MRKLGPSLVWAAGIIGGTLAAVIGARSGWWVLAGPIVLALAALLADALRSRQRPSAAAFILGGTFLLAGVIVAFADPLQVGTMIPIFGAAGWVTLPRCAC
jgi:hypothetical protein